MAYVDEWRLLHRLSEAELAILSGDPTGVTIDENRVDTAIAEAMKELESILSKRYVVPFAWNPIGEDELKKWMLDITFYNLYTYNRMASEVPSAMVWPYLKVVKNATEVSRGLRDFIDVDTQTVKPKSGYPKIIAIETEGKNFTNEDMDKYYSGI